MKQMHCQNRGKRSKRETRARQERGWRQVARITGAGLFDLPEFFRTGLYKLIRGGLADAEIVRAYERCRAWLAKVKDGAGECECGCGTKRPVDAVTKRLFHKIWASLTGKKD